MVCLFLDSVYKPKYGECIRFLRNDAAKGTINFPATLAAAYKMVDEYVAMPQKQNQNPRNNNANSDDVESYIDIDPSQPEGEICLTNTKYEELVKLDPWWFLLDTASTITICNNPSFLKGIRKAKHPVVIHTSGGQLTATLEGFLPFLQRWVSFHPDCLGNILSFRDVLKAHHVTMNSRQSHTFAVHFLRRRKGKTIKKVHFRPSGTGLFYFDTQADIKETFQRFKVRNSSFSETSQSSLEDHEEHEVLNLTVKEKLKAFSPRQRNGIEKAREVYASIGRPGFDKFIRMIQYRQMPNLPINVQDAKNMMKAYGPDVHALKGKVVRRKPDHVATGRRFSIPPEIINANSDVVLCTDIFFVDGIPFLLAVSRNIRHVFVDVLESRAMVTQVLPLLKRWCNRYAMQGFTVKEIHADPEFRPLRDEFIKPEHGRIDMAICAARAHVPEAERNIRTVKERDRSTVSALPYKYYPRILKISIVKESARALNIIPHADGVSDVFVGAIEF
jgi:hypothetical protein